MIKAALKNPYLVITFALLIVALGTIGFFLTPVDLFPDTSPPQVLILTIEPGADAKDIADKITQVIEKEINTISGIKRIRSTSRDEVSSITAEFLYSKDINEATTDVVNAINRIKSELPRDILPIRVYKITDSTHATMTLALTPKKGSLKTLKDIRLLAENDIKDELLRLPEVGDIDIFGGYKPEVKILIDRDKLTSYNLSLQDVIIALMNRNVSIPSGYIYTKKNEYLVKTTSEFKNLQDIKNLIVKKLNNGYVRLKDIAEVKNGIEELRSLYHGNGKRAIGINILRPEDGHTLETIKAVKKYLPILKSHYPDINFEISNDQEPIITINLKGMRSSLIQAVLLTAFIIFLFLADKRAALIISTSIPLSFLFSLMILRFSPYTMNMVTLSGLIIAVGMVVDASIVVLENIYRHYKEDESLSGYDAAYKGAKEVALANTAGALTTIIVLIPVMFVGGYPQKVLRPLSIMIISTIAASLLASLTVVPLVSSKVLSRKKTKKDFIEKIVSKFDILVKGLSNLYVFLLKMALSIRYIVIIAVFLLLGITVKKVVPILVGELMPPMDTGIIMLNIDIPSDHNIKEVEKILSKVENIIKNIPGYERMSSTIGSEPGEISFNKGGATAQSISITANFVTRDKRNITIWQIEDKLREKLKKIEGIRSFTIMEYGATPISTTKAPFDLIIRGDDTKILDKITKNILNNMKGAKGLVDIKRSWYIDKPIIEVVPDDFLCHLYGVDSYKVAMYLKYAIKGSFSSFMRLEHFLDIPIRVEYKDENIDTLLKLKNVYIPTKYGKIPLRNLVKIKRYYSQPFITREDLFNTIDITGVNRIYTIAQATNKVMTMLKSKKMVLPKGYSIRVSGTPADMKEAKNRLRKALMYGLILLYFVILPMYKSFAYPFVIMSTIPLATIGAFWGLLIFNKPMCMPAMMGMILLAGTIVNNAILLLDFILNARKKGMSREEAIIQSVKIRTRPILMTATTTIIGLTPLVFEMAVGLERLSPLGIVAAAGLLFGTFLTMIIVPIIYSIVDDIKNFLSVSEFSKNTAKMIIFLFIFSLHSFNLYAEKQKMQKRVFSLKEVINYALKNSPELKSDYANVEKSFANTLIKKSPMLPKLRFISDYTDYKNRHSILPGVFGKKQEVDDKVLSVKLEASILLTDFGKSLNSYKSSVEKYLASLKSFERKKEFIVYQVTNIYFEISSVEEYEKYLLSLKKSIKELHRRMEEFYKNGKIAHIDLLKVQVRISEIDDEIEQVKANIVYLKALLAEIMGYSGDIQLKLTNKPLTENLELSFQKALKDALFYRTDLISRQYLIKSSKFLVKSAKAQYYPIMKFFAGIGDFSGMSPSDSWQDEHYFGVRFIWNIFDGGYRKGQVLSAKSELFKEKMEKEKLILSIYKELKKSIADIKAAQKRLKLAKDSIKEAKESYKLEKCKYNVGKGIINDLLDAEYALQKAYYLKTRAKSDYNTSIAEYLFAKGMLLKELKLESKK